MRAISPERIAELYREGADTRQIATRLDIAIRTVQRALRKTVPDYERGGGRTGASVQRVTDGKESVIV